jgi:hypothetical protein
VDNGNVAVVLANGSCQKKMVLESSNGASKMERCSHDSEMCKSWLGSLTLLMMTFSVPAHVEQLCKKNTFFYETFKAVA